MFYYYRVLGGVDTHDGFPKKRRRKETEAEELAAIQYLLSLEEEAEVVEQVEASPIPEPEKEEPEQPEASPEAAQESLDFGAEIDLLQAQEELLALLAIKSEEERRAILEQHNRLIVMLVALDEV